MHQYEHKKLGKFNEMCKADEFCLKHTNVSKKSKEKLKKNTKRKNFMKQHQWEQKFVKMNKTMQECFNKAGIYEIMTCDIKNHEKPRGQSVSGSKCPRGLSVSGV